jgi:hypothetical protein
MRVHISQDYTRSWSHGRFLIENLKAATVHCLKHARNWKSWHLSTWWPKHATLTWHPHNRPDSRRLAGSLMLVFKWNEKPSCPWRITVVIAAIDPLVVFNFHPNRCELPSTLLQWCHQFARHLILILWGMWWIFVTFSWMKLISWLDSWELVLHDDARVIVIASWSCSWYKNDQTIL